MCTANCEGTTARACKRATATDAQFNCARMSVRMPNHMGSEVGDARRGAAARMCARRQHAIVCVRPLAAMACMRADTLQHQLRVETADRGVVTRTVLELVELASAAVPSPM